ncbi:MAG: tetratricopeptide repeat protein, partial [Rhodospirillales bacterium]|nr:tetratricopeptide repeat protein [Rhodospirillales bacterium]
MAKLEKIFQEALQYQRAGKLEAAVEVYKQFLLVVPSQPDALNNMGVCLIELDRSNEAIKILSGAVDIYSRDHELLNNLGNALQKSKRIEDAVARFHSALDLQPNNITILLNLSRNLLRLGEYDRALSYLKKARDLSPENANVAMVDTLALPVVYNSAEEIVTARERLTSKLAEMENQTWKIVDPATTVGQTNFFLAYQGANDKDIQSRVAALYLKSCPDLAYVADHCRPYKRG